MPNAIESLDKQLSVFLSDWSISTTLLALIIAGFVAYPILFPSEPDTHPLLLARQSSVNPVRNKNESAAYRSPEVPHGYPLKTGLNVKDEGAPRWSGGKDGDMRDIWRVVRRGGENGEKGLIMTVLGKEELVEHDIEALSKEMEILGKHLKEKDVKRVAIYLPNSVEFLLTIFACSFYGLTPILLPYNLPHQKIYELLSSTSADSLICSAGAVPLDDVAQSCQGIKHLTWVVEKTSRHMDWNGVPDSAQGRLSVSVWHDVVEEETSNATGKLPNNNEGEKPGDLITVWQSKDLIKTEIVEFTQQSLVSGIGALITALPARQRLSSADLVVPASSFPIPYVLCQTMAALYQHASLAITSVAEPGVDISMATRSVAPTVIIASAETMAAYHQKETAGISNAAQKFGKFSQSQTLSAGRMPTDGLLFRFLAPHASAAGNTPGTLRLILTSERVGCGTPPLTSTMLSDLRIFTRARICYALTAAKVCGAVAQTNVFDYRREDGLGCGHFGLPLSSVEVKLVSKDDQAVAGTQPEGEVVVSGPAVVGQRVELGVKGRFREDGTLQLVS